MNKTDKLLIQKFDLVSVLSCLHVHCNLHCNVAWNALEMKLWNCALVDSITSVQIFNFFCLKNRTACNALKFIFFKTIYALMFLNF